MNLWFVNLPSVPIYSIAYVNGFDHIVQNMNEGTQHDNQ